MNFLFVTARVRTLNPETNQVHEAVFYATPFFCAWDDDKLVLTLIDFVGTRVYDDVISFSIEREGGIVLKEYNKTKLDA